MSAKYVVLGLMILLGSGTIVSRAQSPAVPATEAVVAPAVTRTSSVPVVPHDDTPVILQLQPIAQPAPESAPAVAAAPVHPSTFFLSVPFTSQAPLGDWRGKYQDTCEEASLFMVHRFLTGQPITDAAQTDRELNDMLGWEKKATYGLSITLQQLSVLAREFYGYSTRIVEQPSIEDLERQIAAGHPVIAPTAGKLLLNPYFEEGGPWYHMLVIIGYDEHVFYTHDPGTHRGELYAYPKQLLWDAIHDWTGVKTKIAQGAKRVMVVER